MMKKLYLLVLITIAGLSCANAQDNPPYWINNIPQPENETYYFRVTHAEETTYEKAYVRAFSMAILESSWKMGLPVDAKNDMSAIEQGVDDNISIRSHQSNLALNKVCEWQTKNVSTGRLVLYVLWQVAASGNIEPRFEEFNKCR